MIPRKPRPPLGPATDTNTRGVTQLFRTFPNPAAFPLDDPRMVEAARRAEILALAETLPSGWPARAKTIKKAVAEGRVAGPAPSRMTLVRWAERYEAAGRSVAGLIDAPRAGRPREEIPAALEEHLRQHLRARPRTGPAKLLKVAQRYGEEHGLDVPGYHVVRRWRQAIPLAELVMAIEGTKAARAKTQPKREYPVTHAHETWLIDETRIPIWMRIWNGAEMSWVPAAAWGVFVRDLFSRAIVGFWVKEPRLGAPQHTIATHEEILATLAGAAIPGLAHPELLEYAIGAPKQVRMDGSGGMSKAWSVLRALKYDAAKGEPNAPWTRGSIERYFRTLKERDLADLAGHMEVYAPFDPEIQDPRTTRDRRNADDRNVAPYRHEIPVESLPDIGQLRALVAHAVCEHNRTPTRALRGETPRSVWHKTAQAGEHDGTIFVTTFSNHRVTVSDNGVEIHDAWYNSSALQEHFAQGTKVFVRKDPHERGILVFPLQPAARARSAPLIVPTRTEWVRTLSPNDFIEEQRRKYAALREDVNASRAAHMERTIGVQAVADLRAGQAEREAKQRKRSRKAKRIARAEQQTRLSFDGAPTPLVEPAKVRPAKVRPAKVRPPAEPGPAEPVSSRTPTKVIPFTPRRPSGFGVRLVDPALDAGGAQ